jgi:hypothetical protein
MRTGQMKRFWAEYRISVLMSLGIATILLVDKLFNSEQYESSAMAPLADVALYLLFPFAIIGGLFSYAFKKRK